MEEEIIKNYMDAHPREPSTVSIPHFDKNKLFQHHGFLLAILKGNLHIENYDGGFCCIPTNKIIRIGPDKHPPLEYQR